VRGRKVGTEEWTRYNNSHDAAAQLKINQGSISKACNEGYKVGGYEFEFDTPNEPALLPGEEWRAVEDTSAAVSSFGRFRSTNGVVSTPSPRQDGYVSVKIHKKDYYMHRLMAIAFQLVRLPGQDTVNHKVGKVNHITNLEWASHSEQMQHSHATNTERKSNGPKRSKPVRGRKVGTEEWTRYENSYDAAKQLEIDRSSISKACIEGYKAGGYEFEFDAPNEDELLPGEEWRDVVL
jgi:hypothetical protein